MTLKELAMFCFIYLKENYRGKASAVQKIKMKSIRRLKSVK